MCFRFKNGNDSILYYIYIILVPNATEAKKKSQINKCLNSTSASLGFRICGLKTYNNYKNEIISKNKFWGRELDINGLMNGLILYFSNGKEIRYNVIKSILCILNNIRKDIISVY